MRMAPNSRRRMGTISLPLGRLAGRYGRDETAGAVEHENRLKAAFSVKRVEQTQLLVRYRCRSSLGTAGGRLTLSYEPMG
jgi:hypothetical protein